MKRWVASLVLATVVLTAATRDNARAENAIRGVVELFTALSHREMTGRGWTALMGGLSILAGIVLLAYPGLSLVTLAIIVGVWLLIYGLMEILFAVQLRSLTVGRRPAGPPPAASAGPPPGQPA